MIENYVRDKIAKQGYQEVRSPQLYHHSLFEKSGHSEHYADNMFNVGEQHSLKPMNCPAHVQIFNANTVSYKDLPIRLAEFGCCHRNEPSGSLHGIMRLRQFVQDDAHIFCAPDMVADEIIKFIALLQEVYRDFGFDRVTAKISLRPDNKSGSDALWDMSESSLIEAVQSSGLPYELQPGEGAFYGPKLEFALEDSAGRVWQCGTLQLDFVLPDKLSARYMGEDGKVHRPVMLHRAILGSIERFIGILLEHYQGKLPVWLSPVQAVVIPIDERHQAYAEAINSRLGDLGWRVQLDPEDKHLMSKIKNHSKQAIPYIIVVGDKEMSEGVVNVRRLGAKGGESISLEALILEHNS